MRKIVLLLCVLLVTIKSTIVPCGRCVGQGDVCALDSCVLGTKCTDISSRGTASVCYPTIKPGEWCNDTKDYDPCESGFTCQRSSTGKCDITGGNGAINDGCLSNDYCSFGLSCINGLCKLPENQPCSSSTHCLWNFGCGTNQRCVALGGTGDKCTSGTQCKWGFGCSNNGDCVEFFTIPEGGKCSGVIYCKAGLDCYDGTCVKPAYHFLGGPGVAWGETCDPVDGGQTCRCNYMAKVYMYLKEASIVFGEGCSNAMKSMDNCMREKECSRLSLGYESCMRKYCTGPYRDIINLCGSSGFSSINNPSSSFSNYDPSMVPPVCGATSIFITLLLVLVLVLL